MKWGVPCDWFLRIEGHGAAVPCLQVAVEPDLDIGTYSDRKHLPSVN